MYLMDYDAVPLGSYHGKILMVDEAVTITIILDKEWTLLWADEAFLWSDMEVYFIYFLL